MDLKKQFHQNVIRQVLDKDAEAASPSIKLQSSAAASGNGVSWDKSRGESTNEVIVNAKQIQKELVDQAQLQKFKDSEKNKKIEAKFRQYSLLAKDKSSVEKLRKKITHDIEHQMKDLISLREEIAQMAGITVDKIEVPESQRTAEEYTASGLLGEN